MRLLLDTHALIWWTMDAPELTARSCDAIADPANEILVSGDPAIGQDEAAVLW